MKLRGITPREAFLLAILVVCIGYYQSSLYLAQQSKDRDAIRISDVRQVRAVLEQYYLTYHHYPNCVYHQSGCTSLEGTALLPEAPRDPLTNLPYTYSASASGSGSTCTTYHIGASLERTASQALLTGSDAPPKAQKGLCKGSAPDFSGLSYAKGGYPCNAEVGTAEPTDAANGETCYDLVSRTHY